MMSNDALCQSDLELHAVRLSWPAVPLHAVICQHQGRVPAAAQVNHSSIVRPVNICCHLLFASDGFICFALGCGVSAPRVCRSKVLAVSNTPCHKCNTLCHYVFIIYYCYYVFIIILLCHYVKCHALCVFHLVEATFLQQSSSCRCISSAHQAKRTENTRPWHSRRAGRPVAPASQAAMGPTTPRPPTQAAARRSSSQPP